MKRMYAKPLMEWHELNLAASVMTASKKRLIHDETADGDESLSRWGSIWDDEEEDQDETY